jgi:hypothetical protein
VSKIRELLPEELLKGIEHHCPQSRLTMTVAVPKVEKIPQEIKEVEPEEIAKPEETVKPAPELQARKLSMFNEDIKQPKRLKVAVLGKMNKNSQMLAASGFGQHKVEFIDPDRMAAIKNGGAYDATVLLNRLSHKATESFIKACGQVPRLYIGVEPRVAVHTVRGLKTWLELYDRGFVEL